VEQYLAVFVLLLLGMVFGGASLVASSLLGPRKKPSAAKLAPYEIASRSASTS